MNPSVNISRYQRLDGTVLKLIACLSMFIDHLGAVCFSGMMGFRIIGRLAFPIYCFLLVEGAVHTHDMKKYILRMGIFALISEVPFDLAFYHRLVYTGHQNVFFTLGLGLLAIWFLEHPIEQLDIPDVLYKLLVIIAAGLIAEFFNTDYGFTGIAVICIFYYLRGQPQLKYPIAAILLAAMGGVEFYAVLALIPILLYNGQRGRQTKVMQYGFYIFYPAHLLLIAALYHLFIL
uniref:TraX family protein n=1 Tax=Coprococcus catus TaxID=116085 RepID=UPI0022DEE099|nr:TraX family protein [Coprococcus catus]